MKTKRENTKILIWAKKIKAVELLGGKCEHCNSDNIFHLVFHHKDASEKEFDMASIKSCRWSTIEKEVKKCILLCNNCHAVLHFGLESSKRSTNNKKLFLEIKNNSGCEICGYDKCNGSLSFHHLEENKNNNLGDINTEFKNVYEISDELLNELESCQVVCRNCHQELHTDTDFFETHKEEIYEKSKNVIELPKKIDRELIHKMYYIDGMKQHEIRKILNCSKSVISKIIKKMEK